MTQPALDLVSDSDLPNREKVRETYYKRKLVYYQQCTRNYIFNTLQPEC